MSKSPPSKRSPQRSNNNSPRSARSSPRSHRSSSPQSNRSPIKFTSPYTSKSGRYPQHTTIFSKQYEEILEEDVTLLRNKESTIYDLNDQTITLARVVSNQNNEIAILKNQIRNSRLQYLSMKKKMESRKVIALNQKSEYDEAMGKLTSLSNSRDEISQEITCLRQTTQDIQGELQKVFELIKPEDPEVRKQYQTLSFEVDQLKSMIRTRKNRIDELNDLKTKCQNDIEELNVRFEELTNTNEELKQKSEELATKDDNILHILTEPYDPLTNEAAYVEKIEHEIEEWSKRLEQFPLSETSNDVKKAIDVLYTIQQDNDKRKEVLHKRKDDIVATNLKMTAASRALTSSTRYKTTMTGMRGGVMLNHQHKLAINMVKDIFLKISQKEQFIADENQMVDEMIEEHQKKIDPIMKEWNDKMLKVEELTKNLSEIDAVVIDIARVTNETDELKREETQLKYEIEKNQRVISNIEDDKKNIERKQKENQSIKERIEMKRKQIEEYGKELQEKREVIEADRAKYDVGYAEYLEEEKKIEEIKKLQGELSKKLESTVANGNALIGSLGITEDEYDYSQDPSFTQDPSNTPSQKQTKQGYTIQPMSPLEVSQIEGKDPGEYSILENSQTNDTLQDSTLNESTLDESQLNESQIALSQLEESPIKKPSPENQNQEKESIEQVNHEPINQNNEEDTPVVATE